MNDREQFQRFKEYMDAPCHELDKRDGGRNDPHRLAFAEWGVPQEFLLWLWQAAEQASRRAALEEVIDLLEKRVCRSQLARGGMGQIFAETQDEEARRCADAIRALSSP